MSNIQALRGVLSGTSLAISPGERVALLGANGSGKSTLLHTVVALRALEGGTVRVDGLDPFDAASTIEVRRRVGFVQQRPDDQIVATSVEDDVAFGPENLGLARAELRARVTEALAAVGLSGLESREPHTLSGGQKQRLVIAGALAMRPAYLLLDEPTSMLDPAGKQEVLGVLGDLTTDGCGILHVTHDLREAALADRVAVLYQGTIVFEGAYAELLAHEADFATWGIQREMPPITLATWTGEPCKGRRTHPDFDETDTTWTGEPCKGRRTHPDSTLALGESSMRSVPVSPEPATLELRDASVTYALGSQHISALKDISCHVQQGELVVVRGATGSGKSTLLNVMAGLLPADSGGAYLNTEPISPALVRGKVGLIFQDPESQLFAETVSEDISFGPRNFGATKEEAAATVATALRQVGLDPHDFADRSPFLLSGGEARRVAIAGTVALQPQFILADEPTSGLDAHGRDQVRALLASLTEHCGVLVVTHSPEEFEPVASRVYELTEGCITLCHPERSAQHVVEGSQHLDDLGPSTTQEPAAPAPLRMTGGGQHQTPLRMTGGKTKGTDEGKKTGAPGIASFSMYLPGDSPLHRADPRTKLIAAITLVAVLFLVTHWPPLIAGLALTLALTALARIPAAYLWRTLRPVSIIMLFTLVVNAVTLNPVAFSLPGLARGALFVTRLAIVMMLSTLVTLTTSPVALTDGLTLLMRPLRRLRVPVDDIAMMLSIALRFIPTIAAEATTIIKAQTSRGARFNQGSLLVRLRAWIPVIIPLLVQLFRRADTLAFAMEARCYTGIGRTRLRVLQLQTSDWLALATTTVLAVLLIWFR